MAVYALVLDHPYGSLADRVRDITSTPDSLMCNYSTDSRLCLAPTGIFITTKVVSERNAEARYSLASGLRLGLVPRGTPRWRRRR